MKVKELIEKLKQYNENKEVIIRFGLSEDDDVGYGLKTVTAKDRISDIAIYAEYTATPEECEIFGQVDLTAAYYNSLNKTIHLTDEEYKKIIENAQKDVDKKWQDNVKEILEAYEHTDVDDVDSTLNFYSDMKKLVRE